MKKNTNLPEKYSGISPFLTRQELAFVKAAFAPKVSELTPAEAEKSTLECINRAYAELGQLPAGSRAEDRQRSLSTMSHLILNDLTLYFPLVTIAEVSQAIKRGIRREFGEYYGFNVISVHGFVDKYLDSEERRAALERQQRHQMAQEATEELSEEAKLKLMEDGLKHCEETYRKTGRIIDFGSVNYQMLVDRGKIKLTNEQKREIYEMAKWEIKRENENQELSLSKALYLIKNPPDQRIEIIARAREIALRKYFDSIQTKDV